MKALIIFVALLPSAAVAEVRHWEDISGKFRVHASFVEVKEDMVGLRKESGKVVWAPVSRLSSVDKRYVQRRTVDVITAGKAAIHPGINAKSYLSVDKKTLKELKYWGSDTDEKARYWGHLEGFAFLQYEGSNQIYHREVSALTGILSIAVRQEIAKNGGPISLLPVQQSDGKYLETSSPFGGNFGLYARDVEILGILPESRHLLIQWEYGKRIIGVPPDHVVTDSFFAEKIELANKGKPWYFIELVDASHIHCHIQVNDSFGTRAEDVFDHLKSTNPEFVTCQLMHEDNRIAKIGCNSIKYIYVMHPLVDFKMHLHETGWIRLETDDSSRRKAMADLRTKAQPKSRYFDRNVKLGEHLRQSVKPYVEH